MTITILMYFTYFFEMLISFSYFSRIYKRKFNSKALVLFIGTVLFLIGGIAYNLFESPVINILSCFISNLLFALICFNVSFIGSLVQAIMIVALMSTTETIQIFFYLTLSGEPFSDTLSNPSYFIFQTIASKMLLFIVLQFFTIFFKKAHAGYIESKQFLTLFLFPAMTIAFEIIFMAVLEVINLPSSYLAVMMAISILNALACIFIFNYYQSLAESKAKIDELESEKMYFELNNTYLNLLEQQNDELQMLFHDTKHHYLAINSFESIDDVKAYLNKIYPDIESKNKLNISNNKILDLIINKYIMLCRKSGIEFNYEVKTANLEYIDDAELSIILNNILDNAVESALKSERKIIDFSIRHINNMDILNVVNSCDNAPRHKDGQLFTTKENTRKHGFGTRIIEKHAKMNNGEFDWSYDDKEKKFHTTILFQPQNQSIRTEKQL